MTERSIAWQIHRGLIGWLCFGVIGIAYTTTARGQLISHDGLVNQNVVNFLPESHLTGPMHWNFRLGAFESAEEYLPFYERAAADFPSPDEVNWTDDLMLFAIWPVNSNDVGVYSWEQQDDRGVLGLSFAGILPYYEQHYPAAATVVSRDGLGQIDFELQAGTVVDPTPVSLGTLMLPADGFALGDLNRDGFINAEDLDLLATASVDGSFDPEFDLDMDGELGRGDRDKLVHDILGTHYGDTDLDGAFTSRDLVAVLSEGRYHNPVLGATWVSGDWNGDLRFNSGDLVLALSDGGYEVGAGVAAAKPVPEPVSIVGLTLTLALIAIRRRL